MLNYIISSCCYLMSLISSSLPIIFYLNLKEIYCFLEYLIVLCIYLSRNSITLLIYGLVILFQLIVTKL